MTAVAEVTEVAEVTAAAGPISNAARLEISTFKKDQHVDGLLYLARATSDNDRNGKWYLRLTFRDLHGVTIDGKLWNCADAPPTAGVYRVVARLDEYKGVPQLKLLRPLKATPEVDSTPYLVGVRPERAGAVGLRERFLAAVAEVRHKQLAQLLAHIFDDETLRLVLEAPAALHYHGCFPGGLAYHTLEVRQIALERARSVGGAGCDLDLLAAGALLHDVGKIDELEYSAEREQVVYRRGSPNGRLFGHMMSGVLRIYRAAFELGLEETPVVRDLIHMVISHHGRLEWGAAVPPSTIEARLLHAADQCSAEVELTLDVMDRVNTRPDGEWLDGGSGRPRLYVGGAMG